MRCVVLCSLRQVDVALMKSLQDRVNVVPVIAKSDTLNPREVAALKSRVRTSTVDIFGQMFQ